MRFDNSKDSIPRIGGDLTSQQLEEIEIWTHVPPYDGFTLQLQGTGGVIGNMHKQVLMGFRGSVLSEMISIEYLLAAIPLTDELNSHEEFSLKFWEKMNENKQMFSERIKTFKKWIDNRFIYVTPDNFDTATELLLDVRNSLSHYPVQAAFHGTKDTLTPFIYRASKGQMFIFDDHKITVLDTFCAMVKNELQMQLDKLNKARNSKEK